MESPVVTATAGLLLFPESTIVPTLIAKLGISRSLGIPNATNRKAVSWNVDEAEDILIVEVQESVPRVGSIGRRTPPESVASSEAEVSIVAAAEAARQT